MRDATPPHAAHHRDHHGYAGLPPSVLPGDSGLSIYETPEQSAEAVRGTVAAENFLKQFYARLNKTNGR